MDLVLRDNPAKQLWEEMRSAVSPLPEGVEEVPAPIPGTAFFPGGVGLWLEENLRQPFPAGQIMVVGQDFNSVKAHGKALNAGTEVGTHPSPTWRELLKLLRAADVSPHRCFFTNLYMGLRTREPETGRFPGARDEDFVARCLKFFTRQLEMARPKLILTLGVEPIRVLATKLFNMPPPKTLTACTEIYPVSLDHGNVTVVALTHPSFYKANVWRRKYGQLTGMEAEKAMIKAALKSVF